MIPVKLTIQGLFSYQERQTIDFQRLTEAHLFGIFGSVGSGKSSILDAITYALYGETERMNARDNRNYNMMNLKSDELFIEFDFSAGNGSNTYRSVVRGKRNRKKFDDVKTLDRSAYKSINGTWVPVLIEELQQVIGLSYENFKRTIIIPQGKFQEFLQLGNKDRTQMMKELFNLEKFELFYKTVALETRNNKQMQMLQGQLQQLGEVKPEQLEDAQLRMNAIAEEIKLLTAQLTAKQLEEAACNQLNELFTRLKEQQKSFENLKANEAEVLKSEQNLKEYEFCLTQFKNIFDQSDEVSKKVAQYKSSVEAEDMLFKDCTLRLTQLQNSFSAVKTDYEQRELIRQQAGELMKIIRIIELTAENQKNSGRILKGEETCNSSIVKIETNKKLQDGLTEEIKTIKANLPNLAELSKVQNWFTVHKSFLSGNLEYKKETDLIISEINALNVRLNQCVCNYLPTGQHYEIPALLEFLNCSILEIKKVITGIDLNIEHLSTRAKLVEYATNLEEGNPCPLCGSLSHPDLLVGGDVKSALQKERDAKLQQAKVIESLEKVMVDVRRIETQLHLKNESVQRLKSKMAENQARTEEHQVLFTWPDYKDDGVVAQLIKQAESMLALVGTKELQLENVRIETDKEQILLENYRKNLDKIREQLTINQSEINTLNRQIEKMDLQAIINQPVVEIRMWADKLMVKYSEIESSYQKITAEITIVEKRQSESSGRLQANKQILIQEQDNLALINEKIINSISASGYSSVDQIKAILQQKLDTEAVKKFNRDFRQQLHLIENQLQNLKADIGERLYVEEDHLRLKNEISKLNEEQAVKNRELGKTEGLIRKLIKDLEQQQEICKLLKYCELRAEDIKTMKQLFKGSGFVNYVSSVHLRSLCLAANDRFFKLVRQKMSLEITDDNNFQVCDFMNGGKVRSVKTLSGGQTFQASLSLALALADSIQQFTASSQNFFFLDEGFGSLDKESLDIVFETLKSLRKENRIVGVISHVEEMQQEIDTHLRIINNEETGSQIYRSWEG